MKFAFSAALAGVILTGCAAPVVVTHLKSAPPVKAPGGSFLNSGTGFTIILPSSWMRLPKEKTPNPEGMFSMSRPTMGFGGPVKPPEGGDSLTLVDTNVKVLPTDAPVMVRFESKDVKGGANVKSEAESFASANYDTVKPKLNPFTLPIGDVYEVVAKRRLITGDWFYFVDFVVVDGEKVFTIRFVGNDENQIKTTAETAMQTFRIDPAATVKVQDQKDPDLKDLMNQIQQLGGPSGSPTPTPDPSGGSLGAAQ